MKQNKNYSFSTTLMSAAILSVFDGEGGGSGTGDGGGNTAPQITPEIQAIIDAQVAQQVNGLKTKNAELLGSVRELKDKFKAFEGVDLDQYKTMKEQLDNDEDLKLIQAGKKHEVIEKHTQRMRQAHEEALTAEREKTALEAKRADAFRGAVLDSQILAVTQGLHKGAVEDALLHARNLFTLDANGKAVQLNSDGSPVLGKDGKTPFSPAEWIEMQKELKPHWFPASTSGGGSGGARSEGSGNGKTIKRSDFDALPGHEKAKTVQAGVQIID